MKFSRAASVCASADCSEYGDQCFDTHKSSHGFEQSSSDQETFIPQTNPVPSHMVNAREYLNEDVFSRLSQTAGAEPRCDEAQPSWERYSVGRYSTGNISSLSQNEADVSFTRFLERQNDREDQRLQRLSEMNAACAPTHQPQLCPRSVQLTRQARLHQRQDSASLSHLNKSFDNQVQQQLDKELSFRPKINKASAQLPSRTCEQRSEGDFARHKQRMEKLKKQYGDPEMKEATFAPKVRGMPGIKGRLRVAQNPDQYLVWLERTRQKEASRIESELQHRAKQEAASCTFKPKINPVPPCYKRLAESQRRIRAAQQEQSVEYDTLQPEWR